VQLICLLDVVEFVDDTVTEHTRPVTVLSDAACLMRHDDHCPILPTLEEFVLALGVEAESPTAMISSIRKQSNSIAIDMAKASRARIPDE
jgi:hypothetical protein